MQRIVNDLHKEGFVGFEPNPQHRRAQLVVVTEKGRAAFARAIRLWVPWANSLVDARSLAEIETVAAVMKDLRRELEESPEADEA